MLLGVLFESTQQYFRKNAQRKYHIFLVFRNLRKYIFRKTKIKENIIFFCDKSTGQDSGNKKLIK